MQARLPEIDFRDSDALWLPALPAFAHQLNGGSLLLPHLEPYLIRVLKRARPRLEREAPALLDDVEVFCRQEANHYKVHAAYNAVLMEQYPGLEPFDAEIRDDFQRFLGERSLAWNLAYCEGFESLGLVQSEFFLQRIDDWLEGAEPAVRELWAWHLAEEFEHRSVVHEVLAALAPGWRRRVAGFRFCARHLFGFSARVRRHLLGLDFARGRLAPDDPARRATARAFSWRAARAMGPGLLRIPLPGYAPRPRAMPAATRAWLSRYEGA